jgi:hypothetical protein
MRVMMTGGTGMIGAPLAKRLLEKGHEIRILTRRRRRDNSMPRVKFIEWDGKTLGEWSEQIDQVDAIINLAGENIGATRWSNTRKNLIRDSRIKAGEILTQAIGNASAHPKVFIQASAIGFYGTIDKGLLTEKSPPGDDFLAEISKKWEQSCFGVESMGIRRVIIRTGVVLSKQEGALSRMLLPFKFFFGGPLGSGKQMVSWIHLEDEISAICFLLENENARGIYNLTSPESVTNAELGKWIGRITHRPYWLPAPGFALRLLLGEMSTLVLDGQSVIPERLLESGFQFKFDKISDALSDLLV